MKIFIFLVLLAVAHGKGEKCFAPMICNNVPTWARISMAGEDETCGNQMKQLEGKADHLDRSIDEVFERLEYLKNLKSTTMPVTVDNIKETTAQSIEPDVKLTTQAVDTTTIEPVTTRGIETTSEESTPGLTTGVATTVDAAADTTTISEPVSTHGIETTSEESTAILTTNVETTINAGLCPVHYGGKCFYVEIQDVTLDEARVLCSQNQAFPANIYSEKHMVDVMNEIRSKSSGQIWTGMKVHLTTGAVSMRDGTPAPYVKWRDGSFPDRNEAGLYIYVQKDQSASDQGMGNNPPTERESGVVCEIEVANK